MNKEYELSPYWHAHIIASEARPDELLDPGPPTPRPGAVHACAPLACRANESGPTEHRGGYSIV